MIRARKPYAVRSTLWIHRAVCDGGCPRCQALELSSQVEKIVFGWVLD